MAKKSLGQNFLHDPVILGKIIAAAKLTGEDTVFEIGPGHGRLTRLLTNHVKKVIAIELDRELHEKLITEFSGCNNLELVYGDALKYPYETLAQFKVVANIPYYITTPIIFKLFEHKDSLKSITITVQKEIAERIAACPGSKIYGVLSIMVQYYGKPEIKLLVPKEAFRPVPKVDSAVIHIDIYEKPKVTVRDEDFFFKLVRTAFTQRRKTIVNTLKGLCPDIKEGLLRLGIDPLRRPETLSIEDFAGLSDILAGRLREEG